MPLKKSSFSRCQNVSMNALPYVVRQRPAVQERRDAGDYF